MPPKSPARARVPRASNAGVIRNLWSLPEFIRPASTSISTAAILAAASSNGEVEGPHDHAGGATRAHTVPRRPRRQADHASRTPPTIVRRRNRGTGVGSHHHHDAGHHLLSQRQKRPPNLIAAKPHTRPVSTQPAMM